LPDGQYAWAGAAVLVTHAKTPAAKTPAAKTAAPAAARRIDLLVMVFPFAGALC
jgi:hypothetical protein